MDIRVGKIIKVWPHETADKLFCEEIDLGNGEVRQIASGLRPFYKDSDLQDRIVLVLCNLKKRSLVGFASHGMVLCASNADHTAVEFVVPPAGTVVGERVTFEGIDPDVAPEPENKVAKKKIFEQVAPDLKTNDAGHVVWKSHVAMTSAGIVQALNKMPNASVS
jgi:aminoacyl tRNA synthase complex-interacting multifunctional protein 1